MILLPGVARQDEKAHKTKLVVFNASLACDLEMALVNKGAAGILYADCPLATCVKALRKVHSGELWLRRELFTSLIDSSRLDLATGNRHEVHNAHLTRREVEVLCKVVAGYSNMEISSSLCISLKTVKTHLNNIYKKLTSTTGCSPHSMR